MHQFIPNVALMTRWNLCVVLTVTTSKGDAFLGMYILMCVYINVD